MLRPRPLLLLTVPAVLLAGGMICLAVLTARVLVERDGAVRDGILLRKGHELEAMLRESGPANAGERLAEFVSASLPTVSGAEIVVRGKVLATAGTPTDNAIEMPAFLGREWRGVMMGGGFMGGGGPSGSPVRLRVSASPDAGNARRLAAGVLGTALAAGAGLVLLAFVAARNLVNRQRLEAAEAEHRRLESVALAGAGLAHKIRNPLAVIKGTSQMLEGQLAEPARERARRIVESSERIESLIARLLDFARPPERHPESFDLEQVARDVAETQPGPVRFHSEGPAIVHADRENVVSMIEEFIANARGVDPGGEIEVTVKASEGAIELRVSDRGPGLQLDAREVFQPYVTTRPEGTGLGLAIVKALADANELTVELRNREGGGCAAHLRFPPRKV